MKHRTRERFETLWKTSGLVDVTEDESAASTTRLASTVLRDDVALDVDKLPLLVADALRDTMPELEMHGVLGEGGMGLVQLARQLPLHRDVAVKSLRDDVRSRQEALLLLLREGWVTGVLEHPNIVPIYQLGRDENGDPMIVMKRIEGVSWAQLLRDPSESPREFDSDDPLDWHLEILRQVCNAVHFAHSKGIIHRDLKPDNVMIGAYGEVYVLDWGLAVGLEKDPSGRIPCVVDVTVPAGTPAYMAPEMVMPQETLLSPRTDIFLLGAMLHEVLTGSPPHSGRSLYQTMFRAYSAEPFAYGAEVPEQLAKICQRAMAADPDERFATAEEFRHQVAEFAQHRESERLSTEAHERLETLARLLTASGVEGVEDDPALYAAFGQARFGFEQALQVAPDNSVARDGLQRTLEQMAEREVERGSYRAASLLVADLPHPRPELNAKVEQLRAASAHREVEFAELQRIRQTFDIEIGRTTRSVTAVLLGLCWGGLTFFVPEFVAWGGGELTHQTFLTHSVTLVTVLVVGLYVWRDRVFSNVANGRMVFAMVALLLGAMVMRFMLYVGGVPIETGLAFEILLYGVGGSMIALTLDRRLLWATVPYVGSAVAAIAFPDVIFRIFGVTNLIAMCLLGWVWWPKPSESA